MPDYVEEGRKKERELQSRIKSEALSSANQQLKSQLATLQAENDKLKDGVEWQVFRNLQVDILRLLEENESLTEAGIKLQSEVERLQRLVRVAYREGAQDFNERYNEVELYTEIYACWKISEVKQELGIKIG